MRTTLRDPEKKLEPARVDPAQFNRLPKGASRLRAVPAVLEPALAKVMPELRHGRLDIGAAQVRKAEFLHPG